MSHVPEVSVIIPLFNAQATVGEAIRSLQGSTLSDWEAIVVNDGSADAGPVEVEQIAQRDPRIRVVHQKNKGLAGARNTGLDHARGRHVYFLDADDWVMPDGLRLLVDTVRRSGLPAAYGGFEIREARGQTIGVEHAGLPVFGLDDLHDLHFVICNCMLFRRDVFDGAGRVRFDEQCRRVEDYELWFRLAERGVRWAATPGQSVVCAYRISRSTLSTAHSEMLRCAQEVLAATFARCRAGRLVGVEKSTLDLSPTFEADRQGVIALNWATRSVVAGDMSIDEAAGLYERALGRKTIEPERAAGCVLGAVTVGRGHRPVIDGAAERAWAARAVAWWDHCAARAWGRQDLTARAAGALGEQTVSSALTADAILDQCAASTTVTLLGFGRNGRLLAARAVERGFRVVVRDDRFADGQIPEGQEMPGVTGARMDAPLPAGGALVATPLDDGSLASRFADAADLIRWTEVRRGLAGQAAQRLLSHRPVGVAK